MPDTGEKPGRYVLSAFKSDRIAIGPVCTLGTAFAHYQVTMDDGSLLEADSLAMKGSPVPAGKQWLGNPAAEVTNTTLTRPEVIP